MTVGPPVLVLDVNETLLDLSALRPVFEQAVGGAVTIGEWFARLLHGSLVANHLNDYRPFEEIGVETLLALAARSGIDLDVATAAEVVTGMRDLPPHPDVVPALDRLRSAGFRIATLTNGSYEMAIAQIDASGIAGYLDQALSVDEVRRFKPAPEVYLTAAMRLGVEIDQARLVASHDWDVLGARSVGMPGAFLDRPSVVWASMEPLPEIVAPDLLALAGALGAA